MSTQAAKDFMQKVTADPQERKRLRAAVAADVVAAGKKDGFDFTASELQSVISQGGGGASPADTSIGWS